MKKTLFFSLALCFAASSYAQVERVQNEQVANVLPTNNSIRYEIAKGNQANGPLKSPSDGFYYSHPDGMYFVGFGIDRRGYYPTYTVIPPSKKIQFVDMSNKTGNAWSLEWFDSQSGQFLQSDDLTPLLSGNTLTWSQEPGLAYVTPTMKNSDNQYTLGEYSLYLLHKQGGPGYRPRMLTSPFINWISAADDHEAYEYQGQIYSNNAGWGFLDTDNMYGTGGTTETDDEGVEHHLTSVGTFLVFSKPMSDLYVQSVRADGYSFSQQPLKNNATLTAYITDVTLDEKGNKVPGENILYTLTATSKDIYGFEESLKRNSKDVYDGSVVFTMKEKNPFGVEETAPFTLNDEFAVMIVGFDNPDVDFGINGFRLGENNAHVSVSPVIMQEGEQVYYFTYSQRMAAKIYLEAFYDLVDVASDNFFEGQGADEHVNVLEAPAEGGDFATAGTGRVKAAIVQVAMPWYVLDEDQNPTSDMNYSMDLPDWIQFESAEPAYDLFEQQDQSNPDNHGYYFLTFSAQPLPAGVEGRNAAVQIEGHGINGTYALEFMQGNTERPNAIENTISNNVDNKSIYNLSGQRVDKNYKGIVIKNGRKEIQK